MINETMKEWIDNATYEQLLEHWRNAPIGNPIFQGDIGKYYSEVIRRKRSEVGHNVAVAASKRIGWS